MRRGEGELVEQSGGKQSDRQTRTSEREHEQSKCCLAGFFKKSIILYRLLVCGPSVKLDRHVCRNEQHNPECKRNKFIQTLK